LELNKVDEDEESNLVAWDDVKGVQLDLGKVREARAAEMGFLKLRCVYKYASRAEAKRLGRNVIGVRRVDTNKGDDDEENYRSRLCAMEFRTKEAEALFAATPPLESLRALLAIFASEVYDGSGRWITQEGPNRMGLMVIDIKRAHFYA